MSNARTVDPGRRSAQRQSLLRLLLEAVLISMGVFLALMAEQWRENVQHRELAESALRNFRTEIRSNRGAVAAVFEYHASLRKNLESYFASDRPKTAATFDVPVQGLGPVYFEQTAWDRAVATQALVHMDSELAFALSRAYTAQRSYAAQQAAIVQSTIYARSWQEDVEGFWRPVMYFLSDLSVLDPALLQACDEVLPLIERALAR